MARKVMPEKEEPLVDEMEELDDSSVDGFDDALEGLDSMSE
jgi:hypothetical protein